MQARGVTQLALNPDFSQLLLAGDLSVPRFSHLLNGNQSKYLKD